MFGRFQIPRDGFGGIFLDIKSDAVANADLVLCDRITAVGQLLQLWERNLAYVGCLLRQERRLTIPGSGAKRSNEMIE